MDIFNYISEEEKRAYFELRRRFQNETFPAEVKEDQWMYIRFLRARDLNLDLAEKMLRNHITWRKSYQIDTHSFKNFVPDEEMAKYIPISNMGDDYEGLPINYLDLGNADPKGLFRAFKKNDILKLVIKFLENQITQMQQQSEKLGKQVEQWSFVVNFENTTLAKVTHKQGLDLFISIIQIYEAHYPERLKEVIVINASIYFTMFFSFIKPLLSAATAKKVHVYSKDGWKEQIQRLADPDFIPGFLGGSMTDPDGNPLCESILRHGLMVPENLYRKKDSKSLKGQPGVSTLTVSRMAKTFLKANVTEEGSVLEWVFETESRDIGFAVFHKVADEKDCPALEVVPKDRIDTHIGSEVGMFKCEDSGLYIIVFDNTYSWIFKKEIHYKVEIVTPDGRRFPVKCDSYL